MTEVMDALKHTPTAEELTKFLTWAIGTGRYSLSTAYRMVRRVKQLSKIFNLETLTEEHLWQYVEQQVKNGKKEKSVNNEMKDLRGWLLFKGRKMLLPQLKSRPSPEPFVPTDEQLTLMLNYQMSRANRSVGIRNRVLIEVLAFGGLRLGELVALNIEDYSNGVMRVRSEKGEAERMIPLPPFAVLDMEEYIGHHRVGSCNALFTSRKGRITYPYVRKIIKVEGTRAGMPQLHPHSLRHYCATTLAEHDVNLRKVQVHLGHRSITSTQRYTNLKQSKASQEVAGFFEAYFHAQGPQGGREVNKGSNPITDRPQPSEVQFCGSCQTALKMGSKIEGFEPLALGVGKSERVPSGGCGI